MGRQMNWENIPDKTALDAGYYLFKILSIKELVRDEKSPQLTYLGTFEVEEPKEVAGEYHFERFRIGDETDPEGQEETTWRRSMGAKNLKKLLVASNTPLLDTEEATYEAAKSNRFVGKIVKTPGRAGTQNEGQEFSNMRGYFSVTSQEALQVGQASTVPLLNGGGLSVGSQEMLCPICEKKVARADYGKHLNFHKQEQAQAE